MNERKDIYKKWKEFCDLKELAEVEKTRFTELGNEVFRIKYHNSFENYNDENGDPELDVPWEQADIEHDKIVELKQLSDEYYEKLLKLVPKDFLYEYESCAIIGFRFEKRVKIKFFDEIELTGYIYPWEGDYCGPPYLFHLNEKDHIYLNYGESIESVTILES